MTAPVTVPNPPSAGVSSPWMVGARVFVARIEAISASDPGVRAALRSGLGKPLDEVPRMHRIVAPLLPVSMHDEEAQRAFYTVASLIAAQKSEALRGGRGDAPEPHDEDENPPAGAEPARYGVSLGATFATAVALPQGVRETAAETRLNLLTRQSTPGLHRHLPAAVRQLCDKKTPPDWARLLVDLRSWPRDRKTVGRRWLQDFYRSRHRTLLDAARSADNDADAPGRP